MANEYDQNVEQEFEEDSLPYPAPFNRQRVVLADVDINIIPRASYYVMNWLGVWSQHPHPWFAVKMFLTSKDNRPLAIYGPCIPPEEAMKGTVLWCI